MKLVVSILLVAGCVHIPEQFTCQRDQDCPPNGLCMPDPPNGATCVFPSSACPTGYAYSAYSGPKSNECVEPSGSPPDGGLDAPSD